MSLTGRFWPSVDRCDRLGDFEVFSACGAGAHTKNVWHPLGDFLLRRSNSISVQSSRPFIQVLDPAWLKRTPGNGSIVDPIFGCNK